LIVLNEYVRMCCELMMNVREKCSVLCCADSTER